MSPSKPTVLIVEDDPRMMRVMHRTLELEGYRSFKAMDGRTAIETFAEHNPDVVLLDLMLPDIDGYIVCQRIREFSQVPIIMVTALDSDTDKVIGLDAGADDYIAKPFLVDELIARVKAVLRRAITWEEHPAQSFSCNGLLVDFNSHRVMLEGKQIDLTATEYRLLSYFVRHADHILTPDQILSAVWGDEYKGEHNILRATLKRVRQKLGETGNASRFIITHHSIGYVFTTKPQ